MKWEAFKHLDLHQSFVFAFKNKVLVFVFSIFWSNYLHDVYSSVFFHLNRISFSTFSFITGSQIFDGLYQEAQSLECVFTMVYILCLESLRKVSQKTWTVLCIFIRILYVFMKMILYSSKSFWAWTNLYLFIFIFCTICI